MQSSNHVSKESQTSFIGDKSDAQPSLRTPVTSSSRVLRASRFHNCDKKSGIAEVPPVFVNQRVDKTVKYPRVTVYGLPSKFQVRDVKAVVDKRTKPCAFPRSQKTYLGFSNSSTLSKSLVPCTISTRNQTARKSFPFVRNGRKDGFNVVSVHNALEKSVENNPSIVCDGSNLATLPLKDVTDDDGVNGSLVNYSGLSELKIKSLHCSLHNMPNNMADPKVPVVMIDDSIKKALRDGYSGSQSVISQFQTDSSVIYKGCSNFEIVKHVEHAKVDMEVGDQAIISSIGNVEMPPLLCPSRTNQDYSDRESSKSPEMPILTPFGLETMESDECDAPSLLIKDTVTVNQDVTDSSKSAEVILQSPEGVSNQETTVSSSSNESPKRTPRTEVHFQGRYAYMVGKRIRDPSRFIEHSRDVMKRSTRPRGRPPSVLSRLKLWYDKNSRIAGGSVQKVHGKSFCRSVLKPGRRPIGRSNPFGSEMLIEQSGRTKRGRPRLRRGCPNSISLEQNPHVDVIDGLEFLSFETESDLKGFLRRHPSYTLNMSRLNELDTNGFLLSSNCNTTEVNVDNMNSPKLRLPGEPIVLTKTNDIRRIKGWRNKIFVPEALDDWNMDPDKLRELSMEQRLLLLANFTPEELKERGLWELVASKYGTVKRDEEIIEHRVGRSVVNEFGQILFDNRDIKDTCIPEISKSLESEQPLESKTSVEKEEVVSQKGEKQLDGTSGNCVNVECDAQHSIEQVENCTVKEELPVDSQVQVTSEPATYKSANEANASQSNKSAFVSDFLNEFLRSHSELKISTALSAEQEQKATNTIDTKVVWPAQDNYPVQVFPSKQMISNLPPPVTPAVKRTYHRRIRVDERPPPSKKLTKDSKPMQPAVASNNNVASVRVMIEPVQMSMTDALFATTALVSRSLWDKDLGLLPSPEDIAKVFRSEVSESLECLQRKEAMRQKFSVLISPCHALQAVSAVPPQYCGSPSSLSTKDLKSISILKLRPEFKEASVGKAPVVSRSTSLISDKRNQHNKDPLCTVPVKKCSEPFCELGCVCSSLKGVKRRRIHCGKIQCMFKCICEESVNSEVQSSDGNSPQPLKRRRQIRLPARLKDSLFLWTKGKSPLPNYVSNQVNIVPSIDKAAVEVVKARSSVLLKRPSPNSLCASSRSPLITVIQKKTDSSINAEASKHSNTGSSNKSSSCTKFAVGISSCLPPQKSVTKKSNGLPANSPMLLMVDHPLPSGQTHNVGGRSTCHLLLNPDGTMVPCMIVPIDLNASAESAADPLTPVTLTSVDPVPSSVAEVPVQRPIIRQMTSSALENNKPSITYTRQTARKSVNSMMEQSRIQKEVLQKLNVVKKQSVDKVSSVIKDVVDKMVRKVVMDEKLLEGAARSCRLSKARMTLTRCLNSQGNGSYIGSKVDGNKLRIAGLPHDWRSISKPLDEFPEFGGSLQKLQEVQEVIHKPESQVQQSVDDDTTVASPVESANRADLHRQLEKKRRHEIRNSLHQLSSLITPYIFNSKEQKVSQIPVQQCVLDMVM